MTTRDSLQVEQLIARAHLALLRNEHDSARSLLMQALSVEPGNVPAQKLLAELPSPAIRGVADSSGEGYRSLPGAYGEISDDEARQLARSAADGERARLREIEYRNGLSPLYRGGFLWWENRNARFNLSEMFLATVLRQVTDFWNSFQRRRRQ